MTEWLFRFKDLKVLFKEKASLDCGSFRERLYTAVHAFRAFDDNDDDDFVSSDFKLVTYSYLLYNTTNNLVPAISA